MSIADRVQICTLIFFGWPKIMSGGKKYILTKNVDTEINVKIKAQKKFGLIWCTLIQAVEVKLLGFFFTKSSSYSKIFTP